MGQNRSTISVGSEKKILFSGVSKLLIWSAVVCSDDLIRSIVPNIKYKVFFLEFLENALFCTQNSRQNSSVHMIFYRINSGRIFATSIEGRSHSLLCSGMHL